MALTVITSAQRAAEPVGLKALIAGPPGVGKTSLLRTLPAAILERSLLINVDGGDLAVKNLAGFDEIRPETFEDIAFVAALLGGPDPAMAANDMYSSAHYNVAQRRLGATLDRLDEYVLLFVDSITAVSRLSFAYASQQPAAFTAAGVADLRSAYGIHARQMTSLLRQIQRARAAHVIFVCILELVADESKRTFWSLQTEGQRFSREVAGIVDCLITMQHLDFGDGKAIRGFVCTSPNPWNYPAKDRSGRLEMTEPPDLGRLIHKLTAA
jgi:hypothetical protein